MAGTMFGRLTLEEGDSANSLEGLEIKLGGEGKSLPAGRASGAAEFSACGLSQVCEDTGCWRI